MERVLADPAKEHDGRRCRHRHGRHQFRSRVRAFWRKMNGLPEESEALADGLVLAEAPAEQALQVVQIQNGCQRRMRRLLEIGIYPGAELEVVSTGDRGPVIVKVGETRLALGRNVARSVMVDFASAK